MRRLIQIGSAVVTGLKPAVLLGIAFLATSVYGDAIRDVVKDQENRDVIVSRTKGKLYQFSDMGIVGQKLKDGVLLLGKDDFAKGKSWQDADSLVFLRLNDTSTIKKGMNGGSGWLKYAGMYRHGSALIGYRDVPMFELPNEEEILQAEHLPYTRQLNLHKMRFDAVNTG